MLVSGTIARYSRRNRSPSIGLRTFTCQTPRARVVASGMPVANPAAGEGDVDTSQLGFFTSLLQAPCFRDTALYSIGGSATLAALHLQRNRDVMRSAEVMVKSGCGFAAIQWVICRKRYYNEREATYSAVEAQKQRAIARRAAAAESVRRRNNQSVGAEADP